MTVIALRCVGLTKRYGSAAAVQGFSFELERGRTLALLGPSGCGKTTLLRLIAGLEVPDAGTIEISGAVRTGPGVLAPPEARRVGIVFQDYALFPHMTVEANIAYGLPRGDGRKARVREMLSLVGLAGYGSRLPYQLSGGEQQRVALARALAPNPDLILMDEPFSNLDADLRARVRGEVKEILSRAGATVVFVTHDQEEALSIGDVVGVMHQGRLEQLDLPERIFHRPASRFVATFLGMADFLPARLAAGLVETEVGLVHALAQPPTEDSLEVMVRPDDLVLTPTPDGQGIVLSRVFQGPFYLYRVALDSGTVCHCLASHTDHYEMGTRVAVRLRGDHPLLCFVQGQPVTSDGHPSWAPRGASPKH